MSKNGLILLKPTSIAYTGTSASISANGSVSFSACSVLSLNGVFSADYDNYTVVLGYGGSASTSLRGRWRASGTDEDSASNYYTYQVLSATSTTVSGSRSTTNTTLFSAHGSSLWNGSVVYVYGPYLTQPTAHRNVNVRSTDGARIYDYAGTHSQSLAYDGFTIYPDSGNITGLVSVYGMRK